MAKFFKSAKWKRRLGAGLAIALSATLSFGILSACGKMPNQGDDTEEDPALPTDTQLIKNGTFEFYNEMTKYSEGEDLKAAQEKRRTFINSPQSWSTNSENPSSDSASGVINVTDWDYMSRSTRSLILPAARKTTDSNGNEKDVAYGSGVLTDEAKKYALDGWDEASLYDRAEFFSFFKDVASSGFEKYDDYKYSVDFDDLRYLYEDMWGEADNGSATAADNQIALHYGEGEEKKGSSVLMIHNHRYTDSEKTSGTAKYYTSSTDVSLPAGTAAEVSVWVKTINLKHYDKVPVTKRGGAYIAVTNNVGSTALDQMQINDIITTNAADQTTNNGWQKYTIYIRANTFASTTFRIVLGLGRGTSDDRYEAIDGIALFDDLECKLIDNNTFQTTVYGNNSVDPAVKADVPQEHICTLTDKEDARKFYSTSRTTGEFETNTNYALDLKADFDPLTVPDVSSGNLSFGLTKEDSGSLSYTSADFGYPDNTNEVLNTKSVLKKFQLDDDDFKNTTNGTLKAFYEKDFKDFPFAENSDIIMLLSTNGAAYTATLEGLEEFTVGPKDHRLVSFWVKTSSILPGRSGAGATLVDGENRVSIASFDSSDVPTVDVDEKTTDIWKGWVQCFFFVENNSDEPKTFSLELTFGPTAIASSSEGDYGAGYAAFTNFEFYDLTRAQYNYAATGTYAQKTTLTGAAVDPSVFDNAAANGNKLEDGLATPANYTGVLAGSDVLVGGDTVNPTTKDLNGMGIYTGMLSSEFAKKYVELDENTTPWMQLLNTVALNETDPDIWWKNLFGSDSTTANAAYQPLVLLNTSSDEQPSYGFFAKNASVSANSATKISVRLKVADGTTAYIYLMDVSGSASEGYNDPLKATLPVRTYWYDEDGNVVNMDPEDEDFDKEGKILLRLQENGLYKNEQDKNDTKYYANLANFDKDDEENYVDSNDTPVFFAKKVDGGVEYYAYREEQSDGSYSFDVQVHDFNTVITNEDWIRYTYNASETPETVVSVTGDKENANQWITVNFYLKAGNTAKDYRLELWAGQRDYKEDKAGAVGFPNGGYVFFDRCTTSTVSNFDALLSETADDMLAYYDGESYLYRDENDAEKLNKEYGRYYAFTLYDSKDFERYDATVDEDGDGNPWRKYVQSDYDEKLVYLTCKDAEGKVLGTAFPTVSTFIDYSVSEQMPEKAPSLNDEVDEDDSSSSTPSTTTGDSGNVWLYLASALLAAAILFAIGAVIFRTFWKKRKKTAKVKAPKQPRAPKASKPQEDTQPEQPSEPDLPDENDPYNE